MGNSKVHNNHVNTLRALYTQQLNAAIRAWRRADRATKPMSKIETSLALKYRREADALQFAIQILEGEKQNASAYVPEGAQH